MNPNPQPNPTDPIDHILAAINRAQPSTGMDQRILRALEAQAAQPSPASARLHWLRWKPVCAFALAAAVLAITAATLHHRHSPVPHLGDSPVVAKVGRVPQVPVPGGGIPQTHPAVSNPLQMDAYDAPRVPHVPRLGRGIPQPHAAPDTSPQSSTLVSFPAPPMPLTRQEKLLLRLAHRDDPQALAALTPETFAAQQARDDAAFEDFFPPPIPVEYPTLISQANPPAPTLKPNPGVSK